jgi:hypothetical protein
MAIEKINTLKGLIPKVNKVLDKKEPKKHVAKKSSKKSTKETPITSEKESNIIDIII